MCPRQAAQPERGLGWHSRMSGGWPPRAAPRMPRSSAGCPRDGFMRAPTGVPACVLGRLHQRPRVLPPLPPQIKFVTDRDGNPAKLGAGAQGVVYKARRCCNLQLLASGASFQWAVPAAACVGRAAQRPVTSPGQAALPHTNRCVTWCMGMCGGRCSPCPILAPPPPPAPFCPPCPTLPSLCAGPAQRLRARGRQGRSLAAAVLPSPYGAYGACLACMAHPAHPATQTQPSAAAAVRPQVVSLAGNGQAGEEATAFLHEARMLHSLRHRCIVQLAGVALHGDKALLLMEYLVRPPAAGDAGAGCARSGWQAGPRQRCCSRSRHARPAGGTGAVAHTRPSPCPDLPRPSRWNRQEGKDLFSAVKLRDRSGERVFGWGRRGKRVALDVASALAFLHSRRVMHFDVKVRLARQSPVLAPHTASKHCAGPWLAYAGMQRIAAGVACSVGASSGCLVPCAAG